jgi:TM2 domain-containing membrane protein YozV
LRGITGAFYWGERNEEGRKRKQSGNKGVPVLFSSVFFVFDFSDVRLYGKRGGAFWTFFSFSFSFFFFIISSQMAENLRKNIQIKGQGEESFRLPRSYPTFQSHGDVIVKPIVTIPQSR